MKERVATNNQQEKDERKRPRRAKPQPLPDVNLTYSGIRKMQIDDEVIGFILHCIEKHGDMNEPNFEELFHIHPECRIWYGRWELLTVHECVLCIIWIEGNSERLRICTHKTLRNALLWQFHDSPISGHQGVFNTKKRADPSSYYLSNFHRDISDYVKSCNIYEGKKNPVKKKRHFMKSYASRGRFERITADLARPFPKSENGNMYILVVADYFFKYTRDLSIT